MAIARHDDDMPDQRELVTIDGPEAIEILAGRVPEFPGAEQANDLILTTRAIKAIDSPDDASLALQYCRDLARVDSDVAGHFKPFTDSAHKLHKALVARRKKVGDLLGNEITRLKGLVLSFNREQERRRREEEQRLQRERDEAARRERERLEKEAQEEAERLAAEGKNAEAEQVLNQAVAEGEQIEREAAVTPVLPPAPAASTPGASTRKTWTIDEAGIDLTTLVKAAAENPAAFLGYLQPNVSALKAAARSQKSLFSVPGVRAYEDAGIATRKS